MTIAGGGEVLALRIAQGQRLGGRAAGDRQLGARQRRGRPGDIGQPREIDGVAALERGQGVGERCLLPVDFERRQTTERDVTRPSRGSGSKLELARGDRGAARVGVGARQRQRGRTVFDDPAVTRDDVGECEGVGEAADPLIKREGAAGPDRDAARQQIAGGQGQSVGAPRQIEGIADSAVAVVSRRDRAGVDDGQPGTLQAGTADAAAGIRRAGAGGVVAAGIAPLKGRVVGQRQSGGRQDIERNTAVSRSGLRVVMLIGNSVSIESVVIIERAARSSGAARQGTGVVERRRGVGRRREDEPVPTLAAAPGA